MNISILTVFQCPFKKMRLGKNNDGGYIIADIPNHRYEALISGGVRDDISFEESFLSVYNDAKCFIFDGSVSTLPKNITNIKFESKYIGDIETTHSTNIHSYINNCQNIFIKMDIEGAEIDWISSLTAEHIMKISQLTIEFHYPFQQKAENVLYKLSKYFKLIHLHGNNCCGMRNESNIMIPNVFECTYINNNLLNLDKIQLNKDSIPGYLDMSNIPNVEDIYIDHPPFVNK